MESGERIRRLSAQDTSSGRRVFYPTSQTIDHELNPDKYYKIFKSYRSTVMNEPESAFYFAIKHQQNPCDNIWNKKSLLEWKNEVGKPLWKAAQNYSVRKTCISKLLDSDVPVLVLLSIGIIRTWKVSVHTNQHRFNFSEKFCLHSVA